EDLKGKGKIFAMLPIAGTTAAVDQLAALKDVLKSYRRESAGRYPAVRGAASKLLFRLPFVRQVAGPPIIRCLGLEVAADIGGRNIFGWHHDPALYGATAQRLEPDFQPNLTGA